MRNGAAHVLRPGHNPGHHFLASYRRALLAVMRAQFGNKALPVRRTHAPPTP